MAVRDEYIKNNPEDGAMSDIRKVHNRRQNKRHALTIQEQEAFLQLEGKIRIS